MLGDEGFESFAEEQAELFWEGLTGEALEFGGPGAEWAFEDQPAAIAIPQGFRLGTWLDVGGRSLTTHGDRHAALLRELGFTDACVMFNGNDDARFGFGSVSESTLRAFAARLAGGAVRLTLCTWLRPEREFIDDLVRTLPSVARDLGARAIEFDVEEPWTRRHARGFANHAAAAEYLYAALRPATSGIELAVTCQVDVMPTATMRAIVSGADLVVPQAYSSPGAGRSHAIGGVYGPRGLQNRALNKVTEATGGAPKPVVMGLAAWKRERWAPNTPEQILRMELEHTLALPRTAAVQGARYWSWKHIAGLNGNGGAPAQSYGLPFFRGSLSVSPPALPAASNPAPSPGTAPSPSGQRSVAQPASPAAPAPVATPNQAQGAEGLRLDFFEDQERVEARGAEVSSDPEVSLEQSDSDEQAAVALPANIVVKWAGVDRSSIPQRASVPDTDWMGILLDNSNLRFTGAYVTGPALAGSPARSFTNSSQATARGWMPSMRTLVDQGWGAVFFYVGYSVGGNEPAPTSGLDRARGTLHGRHLRTILNALGPSFAGATVFIDNEDTVQTALTAALMDYYSALFDEMVRPDANLACFRPALYGHGKAIEQMLARRRDLFVWDVWLATRTTSVATTPITESADPFTVDGSTRPLKAYKASLARGSEFVSWSLGRQFWYYTGQMPARSWAVGRRLSTWRTEAGWDYNLSFVRNPAFPEAEPRIAVKRLRSGPVIVAGFFAPRTSGATPTPPRSRVTTQGLSPVQTIAAAAGAAIEPDAPIRLSKRGAEIVLATVLANGTLGVATRNSAGTWGAVAPITGRVPTLRRSRALQCWSRTSTDTQLFFVGADHRLYVKRLGTTPAWSDAQIVSPDARLHPFSALAATTRGDKTMELYFIDERALLSIACWTSDSSNPFPGFRTYAIHRTATPTLLPGGAIAATAPRKNHLCVFAVGADLRLHFISWISRSSGGQDWSSLVPLGAAGDLIGPHTRLAAHAPSDSEVEVAALTDAGQLAIYSLRLSGGTWTPAARRVIPDPPALSGTPPAPPAGATTQPARGFRINPFGDLAIFRAQGATGSSVCCAGLRAGESRTLRWDASRPDPWEWFV